MSGSSLFTKVTRGGMESHTPTNRKRNSDTSDDMTLTGGSAAERKSARYISPCKSINGDDDYFQHQFSQNTYAATEYTTNGTRKYQLSSTHADIIHGNITVDELCTRIIDTPEFKRLNRLNQLGCCFEVFRCANHTRFVHSLGVMHLANEVLTRLKQNQPELEITDSDVLCVKVAALCHGISSPIIYSSFVSSS